MYRNHTKFFFFILSIITISSCLTIPKIQIGDTVEYVSNSKVFLKNGDYFEMAKKETTPKTTIILVRHAEKMKDQKDPDLTSDGTFRAYQLKTILSTLPLNHVYSTDYNRTQQTATPTANSKELEITSYNPRDIKSFGNSLLEKHRGENILVVGHSNTTPNLLNHLMKETVVESISESDYGNFYIVNIYDNDDAKALLLKF